MNKTLCFPTATVDSTDPTSYRHFAVDDDNGVHMDDDDITPADETPFEMTTVMTKDGWVMVGADGASAKPIMGGGGAIQMLHHQDATGPNDASAHASRARLPPASRWSIRR